MTDERRDAGDTIEIVVGTEVVEVDLEQETVIGPDIDMEMDRVASRIAYFGELLGAVLRDSKKADTKYRAWRARMTKEILRKDSKLAEWKIKAEIESDPKFETFKAAIATCDYQQKTLEELIAALKEKSPNLRSKGARLRAEFESTDMSTRVSKQREMSEERKAKVKG